MMRDRIILSVVNLMQVHTHLAPNDAYLKHVTILSVTSRKKQLTRRTHFFFYCIGKLAELNVHIKQFM